MEAAALPALMAVERLEEFLAATTDTGMGNEDKWCLINRTMITKDLHV